MKRREFIAGLALPLMARVAFAQQPGKIYRVSAVVSAQQDDWRTDPHTIVFLEEMRRHGYEEGKNFILERPPRKGRTDDELVRDIVRSHPDVILTWDATTAARLGAETRTIPIVAMVADPVAQGLAVSIARPGGNITGFSMQLDVTGKLLELLRELNPKVKRIGYLASTEMWNTEVSSQRLKVLAKQLGISLLGPALESPVEEHEHRRVVAEMVAQHAEALIVPSFPENLAHMGLIVSLAAQERLPAMYMLDPYARLGGLMAYAIDSLDLFRRASDYIDKILRGGNPAEMPFQENTRYKLVLNLKTANELGIPFPPSLLVRADEVIE